MFMPKIINKNATGQKFKQRVLKINYNSNMSFNLELKLNTRQLNNQQIKKIGYIGFKGL